MAPDADRHVGHGPALNAIRRPDLQGTRAASPLLTTLGVVGEILVTAGLVVMLFVVFEIFGTAYIASQHQSTLRSALEPSLHHTVAPIVSTQIPVPAPATTLAAADGSAIAVLSIPALGLNTVVVQGTGPVPLESGPGHYLGTPMPGQAGNVGIAGHRTTWGRPFYNLDQLKVGSHLTLTSPQGTFTYSLQRLFVVSPSDIKVLKPTSVPCLTLTTCNPRFSASTRLVARAVLVGSSLTPANKITWPAPTTPDHAPRVAPAWLLGALSLVLLIGTLVLARRVRRGWIVLMVGVPVSTIALLGFFAAITPFLPANL